MGQKKRRHKKSDPRRVSFRRNRQQPARRKQWDLPVEEDPKADLATGFRESVIAKGELSRKRTVAASARGQTSECTWPGTVVAVRGQFVEVDDGQRVWPCTVRRILRTRRIRDRHPVVVGDEVDFRIVADSEGRLNEGVIEAVHTRRTALVRSDGRRTHTIAANLEQALIISSIREPTLKPHLIDRYLVSAHAGDLAAIVCVNKIDLDEEDEAGEVIERYERLGYRAVATSAQSGAGIDALRDLLAGRKTLLVGQSGVGKSSLLNAVQPDLQLKTGNVSASTEKGRHTTTTAVWLKLDIGGAVVDTPGIRALDVAMVPLNELEMHFVEFADKVSDCKFPNCIHIHEQGCAVKDAVEADQIDPSRYDSYVGLFYELSETQQSSRK